MPIALQLLQEILRFLLSQWRGARGDASNLRRHNATADARVVGDLRRQGHALGEGLVGPNGPSDVVHSCDTGAKSLELQVLPEKRVNSSLPMMKETLYKPNLCVR